MIEDKTQSLSAQDIIDMPVEKIQALEEDRKNQIRQGER